MNDFNATDWAQINRPATEKRDFNADFAEAVGTRDALANGASPNRAVIQGIQSRQSLVDPLFELKKTQMQTQILTAASNYQQQILSQKVRQKQLDDEAADNLSAASIVHNFGGDPDKMMEALNSTFWKSSRGVQNASQWRMQLASQKSQNAATKAFSKLTPQQMAVVSQHPMGSPEWWGAIEQIAPKEKTYAPTHEESLMTYADKLAADGRTEDADVIRGILKRRAGKTSDEVSTDIANKDRAKRVSTLQSEHGQIEKDLIRAKAALAQGIASDPKGKQADAVEGLRAKVSSLMSDLGRKRKEIEKLNAPIVATPAVTPQDSGATNSIPASAIDYLKANPSLREQFNTKYGAGAADKYLSQ